MSGSDGPETRTSTISTVSQRIKRLRAHSHRAATAAATTTLLTCTCLIHTKHQQQRMASDNACKIVSRIDSKRHRWQCRYRWRLRLVWMDFLNDQLRFGFRSKEFCWKLFCNTLHFSLLFVDRDKKLVNEQYWHFFRISLKKKMRNRCIRCVLSICTFICPTTCFFTFMYKKSYHFRSPHSFQLQLGSCE